MTTIPSAPAQSANDFWWQAESALFHPAESEALPDATKLATQMLEACDVTVKGKGYQSVPEAAQRLLLLNAVNWAAKPENSWHHIENDLLYELEDKVEPFEYDDSDLSQLNVEELVALQHYDSYAESLEKSFFISSLFYSVKPDLFAQAAINGAKDGVRVNFTPDEKGSSVGYLYHEAVGLFSFHDAGGRMQRLLQGKAVNWDPSLDWNHINKTDAGFAMLTDPEVIAHKRMLLPAETLADRLDPKSLSALAKLTAQSQVAEQSPQLAPGRSKRV